MVKNILMIVVAAVGLMGKASSGSAPYDFTRQRLFSGFDGKTCKVCPDVATDGKGTALMTWSKLVLTGMDVVSGEYMSRSTDGGQTWSDPVFQQALADTYEGKFRVSHTARVLYSHVNRRWYALGFEELYLDDRAPFQKCVDGRPFQRPLLAAVDAERGLITGYNPLEFPIVYDGAIPFGQVAECENGDLIVPFYYTASGSEAKAKDQVVEWCVTVRYAFDGNGLRVVSAGKPMVVPNLKRALNEPSLVRFRGRYYATLRSYDRGYFAESEDGLVFSEPHPWTWADGQEIGSRNTQQHWLVGGDSLYLAYTRERPDNGHVFRHRAPVFMAKFDPEARCLLKETEMPLVPELGARLGNFCCSIADRNESWLVTAEWMQSWGNKLGICERYGSDNSIWLVKVNFGVR